jgi:hypothetical protein
MKTIDFCLPSLCQARHVVSFQSGKKAKNVLRLHLADTVHRYYKAHIYNFTLPGDKDLTLKIIPVSGQLADLL